MSGRNSINLKPVIDLYWAGAGCHGCSGGIVVNYFREPSDLTVIVHILPFVHFHRQIISACLSLFSFKVTVSKFISSFNFEVARVCLVICSLEL